MQSNVNFVELENLKKRIKRYPSQYRQEYWGYGAGSDVVKQQRPACGTAGCLAFNTVVNHGYGLATPLLDSDGETCRCVKDGLTFDIRRMAQNILNLNSFQADELFSGGRVGWSQRSNRAYSEAKTPKQRAMAAVLAIDDFIAKWRAIEVYGVDLIEAVNRNS